MAPVSDDDGSFCAQDLPGAQPRGTLSRPGGQQVRGYQGVPDRAECQQGQEAAQH
jgi:hypothetical protein